MGVIGLAAGIINITIGGGIFRLPASVAASLGAAAPFAYVVCAVAMGLIVWCIADAGRRVSLTGGPYAYIGIALGQYAGFIAGVLLWMLGTFATAAVSTVLAASVSALVPTLAGEAGELVVLVVAFSFWVVINLRGVTLGAQLNTLATIAKLVPLLLVAVGGTFFIDARNLQIQAMPAAVDVARTSLLLIFAFAGIEVALVPSGEVKETARTVPRAIALAMISITLLYIALQTVAQGVLGGGLAQATATPLADTAAASLGSWAQSVLLIGATVSMFGYLGGMTLSMPRMLFALARDGYLPHALAVVDPRHHTPQMAIVLQSAVALVLAITGTFEQLAIFANVSALVLYLGCALAAWRLRNERAEPPNAIAAVIPWLTIAVIAWLLTGLARSEWAAFGVCIVGASLLYLFVRGRRASPSS
jgi:amino acid transporter